MKKIKAIIFDLDGVLVEMPDAHYYALNRALSFFGYSIERKDHLKRFNGLPTKKKLEVLVGEKKIPSSMVSFINDIKQFYTFEMIPIYCTKDNLKIKLMDYLQSEGLKIGCFSNSIRKSLYYMLESAGLKDYFNVIISNQDVKKPKPDPEGYIKAMSILNVNPEESIIVEDSPLGIQAAIAARPLKVIKVSGVRDVNLDKIRNILDEII
jgi:beta-phosphoglucomutase